MIFKSKLLLGCVSLLCFALVALAIVVGLSVSYPKDWESFRRDQSRDEVAEKMSAIDSIEYRAIDSDRELWTIRRILGNWKCRVTYNGDKAILFHQTFNSEPFPFLDRVNNR